MLMVKMAAALATTHATLTSPVGPIVVVTEAEGVSMVKFAHRVEKDDNNQGDGSAKGAEVLKQTEKQLNEYFAGERREFTVPIAFPPNATPFQRQVWGALRDIPFGATQSYKDIAVAIGNPKAVRAVGMANNRNPVSIIVPCHRVIGADGSLVGYGGGLDKKTQLLQLEEVDVNDGKVVYWKHAETI